MATPGWYPDPAGQPGAFRFWDGQVWGSDTSTDPYAAPPGAASGPPPGPPPAPANPFDQSGADRPHLGAPAAGPSYDHYPVGYGQQPLRQQPVLPVTSPRPGASTHSTHSTHDTLGGGRILALVLLAVLATVALGVATFYVTGSLLD